MIMLSTRKDNTVIELGLYKTPLFKTYYKVFLNGKEVLHSTDYYRARELVDELEEKMYVEDNQSA